MQTEFLDITRYARLRIQNRGCSTKMIDTIFRYADRYELAGSGSERVYISKRRGHELVRSGRQSGKDFTRVKNKVLILTDNMVVTVFVKTRRFKRVN